MDDGDKFYLANVLDQLVGGRVVAVGFEASGDNQVDVPVMKVEALDGEVVRLLVYQDDNENAPGWLELAE